MPLLFLHVIVLRTPETLVHKTKVDGNSRDLTKVHHYINKNIRLL